MSILTHLDLAVRTFRATKATGCSLATQHEAERAVEKLLGEACDEMPNLGAEERGKLAGVIKSAELELRQSGLSGAPREAS